MSRALAIAAICLALVGCTTLPRTPVPPSAADADRQLLVMLRAAPPHFRPDQNYAGRYDAGAGSGARMVGAQLARAHGLALLDEWPMPALGVDCLVMQAPDAVAAHHRLQELSHDPRVAWAQPMHAYHSLNDSSLHGNSLNDGSSHDGDPMFAMQPVALAWHLDQLHRVATGRGVTVAEVDSGVDASHPDLRGRISQSRNFVDGSDAPAERHGTAVAGIIAAVAGNGMGIAGVAPQARLLALRACWQQGGGAAVCNSFTLAKALQFALQSDPQVLNLSLGGPRDELLERLLDLAMSQGISVVGAVDPDPVNAFPARQAGVLAVTSNDADDDSSVSDLRAPGRDIPTTLPGGGWGFVHGSSFAAAEVSGLVALLRELSPRATPAQLRAALTPTEVGLRSRRPMPVDACAAVARVGVRCACDCGIAQAGEAAPRR
ncbi:MAG TPA: S8 family serine peptidase [Rhodanobacteraceae bacterium]|nr:S8 family serine peptidase [Rhodanobacteraceae bacterium]